MGSAIISVAQPTLGPGSADGKIELARDMVSHDPFLLHQPGFLSDGRHFCLPQVLVQAIKEAKEQHPDMSVTKVVVHQETEISEE